MELGFSYRYRDVTVVELNRYCRWFVKNAWFDRKLRSRNSLLNLDQEGLLAKILTGSKQVIENGFGVMINCKFALR